MKIMTDYYNGWKKKAFTLCLIAWVIFAVLFYIADIMLGRLLNGIDLNWINENKDIIKYAINLLLGFVTPTSLSVGVYFTILNYVDKRGWKKKFPNYDIGGEWNDETRYIKMLDSKGWKTPNDVTIPSPVRIEQTCRSVKISMSVGNDFTWYSLLADINEQGTLEIFYKVEYNTALQKKGFPQCRYGYERMNIQLTNGGEKEIPHIMKGKFWHCLSSDGKPIYMGDVTYTRDKNKTSK